MSAADASREPLYLQIRDRMLERFADYPLDAKLPTNRDLAKEFDVALLTVKRALDTLAADGYIDRRQGKGTFLRARERQIQTAPTKNANGTVMITVPNYFSYEYWKRVDVAEDFALKNGYALSEHHIRQDTVYSEVLASAAEYDDLQALLIDPIPDSLTPKAVEAFDDLGIPVVVFSHCPHARMSRHLVTITPDWYQLGYAAVEEMLRHGHSNIGLVEGEPRGQDGNQRVKGMQQALADAGMGKRELKRSRHRATNPWSNAAIAAYEISCELLDKNACTALVCDSVVNAMPVYRAAYERNLRIPDDLSIIACGEWTGTEAYFAPPLTCVSSSIKQEMDIAFSLLDNTQRTPVHTYECDVTMVRRESVAAARR